MKISYLVTLLMLPFSIGAQHYVNVVDYDDFAKHTSWIEFYDSTQKQPRVFIQGNDSIVYGDCRVTKDNLFAFMQGSPTGNRYLFMDNEFKVIDTLAHNPVGVFDNIDFHGMYSDDSLTIYFTQRLKRVPKFYIQDYDSSEFVMDNVIHVLLRDSLVLEWGQYGKLQPKYIEVYTQPIGYVLDPAHINSVEWDGDGVVVSSLTYGVYKIGLDGNIIWQQDDFYWEHLPRRQHDFVPLGRGKYSVFSNGDDTTDYWYGIIEIADTVVYHSFVQGNSISLAMGNYQVGGIVNLGVHPDKYIGHNLTPQQYAYRAENTDIVTRADIVVDNGMLRYIPQKQGSSVVWDNGDTGLFSAFRDSATVIETLENHIKIHTNRVFVTSGLEGIKQFRKEPIGTYNIYGQQVEEKGLYFKKGKKYFKQIW